MRSELAFNLTLIALGNTYIESALHEARNHPVTTNNDRQMLRRYYTGMHTQTDHIRLQELVNEIERHHNRYQP